MRMIKILYLMHVDKKWIKQRPHFFAEEISRHVATTVLFARANNRSRLRKESQTDIPAYPLYQIPFRGFYVSWHINSLLLFIQYFFWIFLVRPTHVIIPLPDMYSVIFKIFSIKVIYDCMDDALAFSDDVNVNRRRASIEAALSNNASIVFASAQNLAEKIEQRYRIKNVVVIRNAFDGNIFMPANLRLGKQLTLGYFGTISRWFDFDIMLPVIEKLGAKLLLAGPCEVNIPVNPWVEYRGILRHADLIGFAESVDILVMPFIVNELILSVDPVKLYEYINFGRPIVCVRYPEIERFSDFCEFYNSEIDLVDAINRASICRKYTESLRLEFLRKNTWKRRAQDMISVIGEAS